MIIFYTGGIKSGKSSAAYAHAKSLDAHTAVLTFGDASIDEEFRARIDTHQHDRSDAVPSFELDGTSSELAQLQSETDFIQSETVILECLGTLLGRIMTRHLHEYFSADSSQAISLEIRRAIEEEFENYLNELLGLNKDFIIISNEVGSSPVSIYPSARLFVDLLGKANQTLAERAEESYFCVSGKRITLS